MVEVAANDNLPAEIAIWIAAHGGIAARETLSMNTHVSADVVTRLLMHADLDRGQLLSHPHAPMPEKLQAPLNRLTDYSLDLFFEEVNATDAERLLVRARRVTPSAAQTTLGQVWAAVRR